MQCLCQFLSIIGNLFLDGITDRMCRIYRDTISGMDTGTLNMFHDTRDQNICTVAYSIDFDLLTL